MKNLSLLLLSILLVFLARSSHAFIVGNHPSSSARRALFASTTDLSTATVENLKQAAQRIHEEQGVLVYDQSAKDELLKAVKELEATNQLPTSLEPQDLEGDWKLLCTTIDEGDTSSSSTSLLPNLFGGIDTTKLPDIFKSIRSSLNQRVQVLQRISRKQESTSDLRIDHVIEYSPPSNWDDLPYVPSALKDAIKTVPNPLELTKSKVILIHKAKQKSDLEIQLSLQSIVLNVAGQSQYLEPQGADVLGINLPQINDMVGSGTFETTYVDSTLRISRTKSPAGNLVTVRVFVKDPDETTAAATDTTTVTTEEEQVEEFADVEWVEDDIISTLEEEATDDEKKSNGNPWEDDDGAPSDVE